MANEERDESFAYANQLVMGSVLPMTMQAAIELGVFKIIAKAGPGAKFSASEIAAQLPATKNKDAPMMLDRILRLLASHGVVECSLDDIDGSQRLYGQSNVSRYFVPNEDGVSLGPLMALIQDKVFLDSCLSLLLVSHTRKNLQSPTGQSAETTDEPQTTDYCHRSVDVSVAITRKTNHAGKNDSSMLSTTTIRLDARWFVRFGEALRMQGVICFKVFQKWILHDWSDEHCLKLLKNCYKSIPEDGKVIVVESILPDLPETSTLLKRNSQIDVLMMTQNPGGKEQTKHEFMTLATGAGFSGIRFECFTCNLWVMEFYK
ncbi:hypothetical protein WN943_015360 [Citrus x changshan-huyou]